MKRFDTIFVDSPLATKYWSCMLTLFHTAMATERTPQCRCSEHETWSTFVQSENNAVCHIERSKVNVNVIKYLKDHNYLSSRVSYLCKACISRTVDIMSVKDPIPTSSTALSKKIKVVILHLIKLVDTASSENFKLTGEDCISLIKLHGLIRRV